MSDVVELTTAGAKPLEEREKPAPRAKAALSVLQLLALLMLVALAPLALFGAGALYLWDRSERQAALERLSAQAQSLSQAIDREIRGYRDIAEGLAVAPALRAGDVNTFWDYAHQVSQRSGGHFALIDSSMQQVVNTSVPRGSALPVARGTATVNSVFETGETLVADFETRSGSRQTQFTILAPVRVDGKVRYVLGFAPAAQSIVAVVRETYRPEGWIAGVVDRAGTIAARSVAHDEFFGRPANADFFKRIAAPTGIIESTDLQGRVATTAWHTSQNGWKVLVWAPREVLERPTRLAVKVLVAAGLLTLVLSLTASWFFSRLIRRPATRLVEAAHRLGEGHVVNFAPTRMAEANAIGASLVEASQIIHRRETDLRASQSHTTLIMRELSHRSKNLLAMVQAMARQSARSSANFADFQAASTSACKACPCRTTCW